MASHMQSTMVADDNMWHYQAVNMKSEECQLSVIGRGREWPTTSNWFEREFILGKYGQVSCTPKNRTIESKLKIDQLTL